MRYIMYENRAHRLLKNETHDHARARIDHRNLRAYINAFRTAIYAHTRPARMRSQLPSR